VGNIVTIKNPEILNDGKNDNSNDEWITIKILDKIKTHGSGNDNNKVLYKVFKSDNQQEYEIDGTMFHPKYIENRNFIGLNNIFDNEYDRK
jgi:methenyltetrahydromethanopterin cyclohydrolase